MRLQTKRVEEFHVVDCCLNWKRTEKKKKKKKKPNKEEEREGREIGRKAYHLDILYLTFSIHKNTLRKTMSRWVLPFSN